MALSLRSFEENIAFTITASDTVCFVKATFLALLAVFSAVSAGLASADAAPPAAAVDGSSPSGKRSDFEAYAMKLREEEILKLSHSMAIPHVEIPNLSRKYPWKTGIVTTVFWVGRTSDNGEGQTASAWDPEWSRSFGGFDDPLPAHRKDFSPAKFVPKQNPFYIALPYNDVAREKTKPEAKLVIPWFKETFIDEGKSVCRNRWVEIRSATGKVCYAQWSDCGPFQTDHWQYVFGNERPKPNANQGTGLNVSPAVRDFLGLFSTDVTDWRFVDFPEVPQGPWSKYGGNNPFLQARKGPPLSTKEEAARPAASTPPPKTISPAE